MDCKKVCFILCINDDVLFAECLEYIERLYLPGGFTKEVIQVRGAISITTGYNGAMIKSDAKYKVYLHQDVFIINRYFIYDLVSIFEADKSIGLIGIAGYKDIPKSIVMWEGKRYGAVPMYGACEYYKKQDFAEYRYEIKDGYEEVLVADGMLLATSCDIEWDEEFDGWDFYDASQCMRLKDAGYKCVVPKQVLPWVVHDDGLYLTPWNYDKYRRLFEKKYLSELK